MYMKHPKVAGEPVKVSESAFAVHQRRGWVETEAPKPADQTETPQTTKAGASGKGKE